MIVRRSRVLPLLLLPLLAAGCTDGDGPPYPGAPLIQPPPGQSPSGAAGGPGASGAPGVPHEVAAPQDGRNAGEVDVVSGATTVTVRAADLGDDRLRASTPEGASVAPALDVDGGRVRVHLVQTGQPGPAAVTVLLDRRVRWQVRLSGGATSEDLDLRGGRLAGIDLAAGASRIELRLPAPAGVVPVRMLGGATDLTVHLPAGVPAGVRVGGGAGTVVVDGVRSTGLSGGTTVTSATAADRYEIDAVAGVATLTVDRA